MKTSILWLTFVSAWLVFIACAPSTVPPRAIDKPTEWIFSDNVRCYTTINGSISCVVVR